MIRKSISLFIALSCLAALAAFGQEITGTIAGTVTDSTGALVPGAVVTVTSVDTNAVREYRTDENGLYVATLLPIGQYKVTVQAKGFKTASRTDIVLSVNDRLTHNFALEVGSVSEVVNVEAGAVQVDLQSATAAGLVTGKEVMDLTLNSRNYEQLVALMPGVTSDAAGDQIYVGVSNPLSGVSNQVTFSINGTRKASNSWTVDGGDNVDRGANLTLLVYPSVDAISEFKVLRAEYTAEFGRSSSGYVNVLTKSGTNHFHGGAYEFFRNDRLQANQFFNNARSIKRPPLRYNDFGWTLGGPVPLPYNKGRDKTFFFFSQEIRRVITYTTVQATVPTGPEKLGVFPQPVCLAFTGATCTSQGTTVPSNLINPVASQYLKDIWSKIPDGPDNNILFTPLRNLTNYRQELIRIDPISARRTPSRYAISTTPSPRRSRKVCSRDRFFRAFLSRTPTPRATVGRRGRHQRSRPPGSTSWAITSPTARSSAGSPA